jgi:hypothetical protein
VGEEAIEAEGVGVDRLAHVADAVGAQDVERERAQAGEDAGLAPDAAGVLAERAVAHVVVAVLDAPVAADGCGAGLGIEGDLAGVAGDLPALRPQAGAGVTAQAEPGDAHDAGDERPPVGIEALAGGEDLDPAVLLAAVGAAVEAVEAINRGPGLARGEQGVTQARLVVLDPYQQRAAGRGRAGERFFGSAGHRR